MFLGADVVRVGTFVTANRCPGSCQFPAKACMSRAARVPSRQPIRGRVTSQGGSRGVQLIRFIVPARAVSIGSRVAARCIPGKQAT